MIPLCGMLQSFKQTLFEGVCQSTILSKFVKLVFGLLFGHSYQQVRMVSKMYTFQDVHTGSHFGKKNKQGIMLYHAISCPCCTITSNLYHIMVGLVYFPPSQGASPKTHPADSSGQSAPSGMDTQFFEAVAAKIPWRQPRLGLQWSGQRALNLQVRNNESCLAWRKKVEFEAKSPLGDKWPAVFCSCIEFLTLLQAKKQHHLGHLNISWTV